MITFLYFGCPIDTTLWKILNVLFEVYLAFLPFNWLNHIDIVPLIHNIYRPIVEIIVFARYGCSAPINVAISCHSTVND